MTANKTSSSLPCSVSCLGKTPPAYCSCHSIPIYQVGREEIWTSQKIHQTGWQYVPIELTQECNNKTYRSTRSSEPTFRNAPTSSCTRFIDNGCCGSGKEKKETQEEQEKKKQGAPRAAPPCRRRGEPRSPKAMQSPASSPRCREPRK